MKVGGGAPRTKRRTALAVLVVNLLVLVGAVVTVFVVDFDDGDGGSQTARRRDAAVLDTDNGGEVSVPVGKPFVIDLEGSEDAPWSLPLASGTSLAVVSSSLDLDGSASATFVPLEVSPGVKLVAERTPACRTASDPCDTPSERFEVTIRVVG